MPFNYPPFCGPQLLVCILLFFQVPFLRAPTFWFDLCYFCHERSGSWWRDPRQLWHSNGRCTREHFFKDADLFWKVIALPNVVWFSRLFSSKVTNNSVTVKESVINVTKNICSLSSCFDSFAWGFIKHIIILQCLSGVLKYCEQLGGWTWDKKVENRLYSSPGVKVEKISKKAN